MFTLEELANIGYTMAVVIFCMIVLLGVWCMLGDGLNED